MTPTESQANPGQPIYYPGIQDLRGWAALCVLLYHAHVLFRKEKYFGAEVFWGLFEFGHRGVDLFFVISGFLMAMLTQEHAQRHQPGLFLLVLARRIYSMLVRRFFGGTVSVTPLFFLVVALALAGGGLYYLLVQRPSLLLFRRRLGS